MLSPEVQRRIPKTSGALEVLSEITPIVNHNPDSFINSTMKVVQNVISHPSLNPGQDGEINHSSISSALENFGTNDLISLRNNLNSQLKAPENSELISKLQGDVSSFFRREADSVNLKNPRLNAEYKSLLALEERLAHSQITDSAKSHRLVVSTLDNMIKERRGIEFQTENDQIQEVARQSLSRTERIIESITKGSILTP